MRIYVRHFLHGLRFLHFVIQRSPFILEILVSRKVQLSSVLKSEQRLHFTMGEVVDLMKMKFQIGFQGFCMGMMVGTSTGLVGSVIQNGHLGGALKPAVAAGAFMGTIFGVGSIFRG